MLARFTSLFKNFYLMTTLMFLVWMLFFDANDFVKQYKMSQKRNELENQKEYYLEEIAKVQKDRAELLSNPALIEKYARENYYMKRPGEDIFIIIEKEE